MGDQDSTVKQEARIKKDGTARKRLGAQGEQFAVDYLGRQGITVLDRNWRCRSGEADIVAREDDEVAFIEVKTRASLSAGLPEEAVTREKRRKYEGIAVYYLASHALPSLRVRFDVISVIVVEEGRAFLRHHRDAYCAGE